MQKLLNRGSPDAFTFLELLIALGIFSYAIISLLVLFPMAQRSERESKEETRATLIAASILEVLELPSSNGLVRIEVGESNSSPLWKGLDPTRKTNLSVVYNSIGQPLHALNEKERMEPVTDHDASAVATLTLSPKSSIPFLTTAEVEVSCPPSAPSTNRSLYRYVKLLNVTSHSSSEP